ncbi:hypothetical protein FDP41_013203 [Naegleria fowleri]|uniref:Uncharacterized protein n=1 Tax=Naegleria fowleri TaxID=5763 RepID=A0A6A5C4D5_NAEFO|nr:uncharacterized protein FDP41_013203 [Naegleria fowleri]KAF0980720.1 hypothetical protein FDP41_013203 [Naegleria fowleri]CAG4719073.1 unnamed protein product [Naegleria fowleri]
MPNTKAIFSNISKGFRDGMNLPLAIDIFAKSKTLKPLFAQCFVLNGCLFVGSIIFFDYIATPLFNSSTASESNGNGLEQNAMNTDYLSFILGLLFASLKNLFWIWPLYTVSFILSAAWYDDIAEHVAKKTSLHKRASSQSSSSNSLDFRSNIIKKITDLIYRPIIFFIFLLQASLVSVVPIFGTITSFVLYSWLYAFYAFEYVWSYKGYSLERRIKYFEERWGYMLAFGAPNAFLSNYFPFFLSSGVWAMLFPMFIVLAMVSKPPSSSEVESEDLKPPRIFSYTIKASSILLNNLKNLVQSNSSTQEKSEEHNVN